MAVYRLQAAQRMISKALGPTVFSTKIRAKNDESAIKKAKRFPLACCLDAADFVWLTDAGGDTIWSVKLKEQRYR